MLDKKLKALLITALAIILLIFVYKILFVRTVNYEIAGLKIPSEYSVITGKIRPIQNYRGRTDLPVLEPRLAKSIGLSEDQVTIARFRWAVFEQWVKGHSEYKGWNTDKDMLEKARAAFKADMSKLKGSFLLQ